ncbi:MAG: hypothetical protein HFH23_07550 [Ruminococcus sp.]|nr:hypothetical protein [Ruminococcus sp.]
MSAGVVVPGGDGPTAPAGDGPAAGVGVVPAPAPAAVAPVTPAAPTPATAVAPPTPVITVPDEDVPLGVMDLEDELQRLANQLVGGEGLTSIEDEEVPLANTNLATNVGHYVIHIIELILAVITGGVYVGTRKQKKEIAKLKKELGDEER